MAMFNAMFPVGSGKAWRGEKGKEKILDRRRSRAEVGNINPEQFQEVPVLSGMGN